MKNKKIQAIFALTITTFICTSILYLVRLIIEI